MSKKMKMRIARLEMRVAHLERLVGDMGFLVQMAIRKMIGCCGS